MGRWCAALRGEAGKQIPAGSTRTPSPRSLGRTRSEFLVDPPSLLPGIRAGTGPVEPGASGEETGDLKAGVEGSARPEAPGECRVLRGRAAAVYL